MSKDEGILFASLSDNDYLKWEKLVLTNYIIAQAALEKKVSITDFREFQDFWAEETYNLASYVAPTNAPISKKVLLKVQFSYLQFDDSKLKAVLHDLKEQNIVSHIGGGRYRLTKNSYSLFVKHTRFCIITSIIDALKFDQMLKLSIVQLLAEFDSRTTMEHSYCSYYYRGHANHSWQLVPNLIRYQDKIPKNIDLETVERITFERFRRRLHLYNIEPQSLFDAYTIAQHHGLPTRLLDWSKNILKALFFVCYNEAELKADGKLFCFSPRFHLSRLFTKFESKMKKKIGNGFWIENFAPTHAYPDGQFIQEAIQYLLERKLVSPPEWWHLGIAPIPVIPVRADKRMLAQEGVFTLFTGTSFDEHQSLVFRAMIPSKYKKDIIRDLNNLGINYQSMFPDLDHFAQHLKVRAGFTDFVDTFQIE